MTTPVTREELRKELANHPTRAELANHPTHADLAKALANHPTHADLAKALANHPTKVDLAGWADAINARTDRKLDATLQKIDARFDALIVEMRGMRIELSTDLARHVRAADEQHRSELAVVDEKYADLPGRLAALEKR